MTAEYSPEYVKLLLYVNETPALQSLLYDLDLLPEQVSEKKSFTSRRAMLAAIFAFQAAVDDANEPKETKAAP